MKRYLIIFLLFGLLSIEGFGSPLIFKTTKEITNGELTELVNFDAGKFRQIRIGIKSKDRVKPVLKNIAEKELSISTIELGKIGERFLQDRATQNQFDEAKKKVADAQKSFDFSVLTTDGAGIFGIENNDEIFVEPFENVLVRSIVIDSPPSRISVKGLGKGTYSIYIWGQ